MRVVLVPGLGLDQRSSARLRRLVDADVVLLPGTGERGPVPTLDELGALLRGRMGDGPLVLVGHSQACQVVTAAAADPRVCGLVLLGPTTDPRLRSVRGLLTRWVATAVREPWWQLPLVVAQWLATGPAAMRSLWRAASPDRLDLRLRDVPVPVAVVRGDRDALCDRRWAAHVAAAAPAGRLVELAGAAHMTVQTHPGPVAAVVRSAVARAAGSPDHRAAAVR